MPIRGSVSRTDIEIAKMEAEEWRRQFGRKSPPKKGTPDPPGNGDSYSTMAIIDNRMLWGRAAIKNQAFPKNYLTESFPGGTKESSVPDSSTRQPSQRWFAGAIPKSNREAILGDLQESASRYSTKPAKAAFYCAQLLRSLLPFIWLRIVESRFMAPLVRLARQVFSKNRVIQ